MKKIIALALAALTVFALVACSEKPDTTGTEKNAEPTDVKPTETVVDEPVDGGMTDAESPVVPDRVKELVTKANETLAGAQYTPVAYLGSQVVAGTNHCILCLETPTVPDAASVYAIITLYEDLDGNAQITDVQECAAGAPTPYTGDEPISGGWGDPGSPEVTDAAKTAVEKACETLTGAEYEPVALLCQQVVAGMNYAILCKATPTVPDAQSYYTVVEIYADLDGGAEITNTYDFGTVDEGGDSEEGVLDAETSQADE